MVGLALRCPHACVLGPNLSLVHLGQPGTSQKPPVSIFPPPGLIYMPAPLCQAFFTRPHAYLGSTILTELFL